MSDRTSDRRGQAAAPAAGTSFWAGNASLITTDSNVVTINADAAAALQTKIGLVNGTDPGIEFAGDSQLNGGGHLLITNNNTAIAAYGANAYVYACLGSIRQTQIGGVGPGSSYAGIMLNSSGTASIWYDWAATLGQINLSKPVCVGGNVVAPTMTGTALMIDDITAAPSTNPVGGGVIYCEAGALKYRGTAGTVTTLAAA